MAKMSGDLFRHWEKLVDDVDKTQIPMEFMKKFVIRLRHKRQKTINIQALFKQGLDAETVEEVVNRQLAELDSEVTSIEVVLDVERVAQEVTPHTESLLQSFNI